jgi:DNA-binding NtrC family response regulator
LGVSSGEDALKVSSEEKDALDLILTDVVLPGINGPKVYERIARSFPGVKGIYMSGYSEELVARRGALPPGVRFVKKPFSLDGLLETIAEVLEE